MSPISADKRDEILALLRQELSSEDIAKKTGVPVTSVRSVRAHRTMGKYSDGITSESLETASDEIAEGIEAKFGLERDLQSALRANIEQLEDGLKIADGGKELVFPSGRIDIVASDGRGVRVAIELKAGTADRDAIGQLLSYMGDLQAEGKGPIRGMLLAGDFTARAVAAARIVPSIELRRYSFRFSFQKIG